ncbi:hypothetical protein ACHAWF_017215 [Thalassiosira exigua]
MAGGRDRFHGRDAAAGVDPLPADTCEDERVGALRFRGLGGRPWMSWARRDGPLRHWPGLPKLSR